MKVIILAAGYGHRMRPLTDLTHKTLLKIGDKTILERIITGLQQPSINQIIIVTGYRSDELESVVTNSFSHLNIKFVNNPRYKETNNIYSLSLAFHSTEIDDDFLLIESDLIYEDAVIKRILSSKHPNVTLVDKFRSGMDGTVVTINSDHNVTNIIPPHLQSIDFDFSDKYKTLNIYKLSRNFCQNSFRRLLDYYSKMFDANCYYELILGMLIYVQKETIHAEILSDEKWTEVDDPNDLNVARYIFDNQHRFETLEHNFGGLWNHDILDFCYIRNMHFPNESMMAELKNHLPQLIHNYGSKQSVLNEKLSYILLCNPHNLQIINGASQSYPILSEYLTDKSVLIPSPTFGEYPRFWGKGTNHYSNLEGTDWQEFQKQSNDYDVLVIVNPNNPTGSIFETKKILQFAIDHPEKLIIVDESFIEFSDEPSLISLLEVKPQPNILIIKSLSKSLGVPGLRLGFIYCQDPLINDFFKCRIPIWNLNSLAEYFLEIMLKHRESLSASFRITKKVRQEFILKLEEIPQIDRVFPSHANFVLVRFHPDVPNDIHRVILEKNRIYLRNLSDKFDTHQQYFRIAVRTSHENQFLINSLYDALMTNQPR